MTHGARLQGCDRALRHVFRSSIGAQQVNATCATYATCDMHTFRCVGTVGLMFVLLSGGATQGGGRVPGGTPGAAGGLAALRREVSMRQ